MNIATPALVNRCRIIGLITRYLMNIIAAKPRYIRRDTASLVELTTKPTSLYRSVLFSDERIISIY